MVVKDVEREDIEFISKVGWHAGLAVVLSAAQLHSRCRGSCCRGWTYCRFLPAASRGSCLSTPTLLHLYRRRCTACPSRTWTTCGPTSWAMRRWWRRWM